MTTITLPRGTTHIPFNKLAELFANADCPLLPDKSNLQEHQTALGNFNTKFLNAVELGKLKLFNKASLLPLYTSQKKDVKSAVVEIHSLYGSGFSYGVDLVVDGTQQVPIFTMPVRPVCVPPELNALPRDAEVICKSVGPHSGTSIGSAGKLIDEFECIIQRQNSGYFTLNEAAQLLAPLSGEDCARLLRDMQAAHNEGKLIVRNEVHKRPIPANKQSSAFELVTPNDVDAWLEKLTGIDYQFPQETQQLTGSESGSPPISPQPVQRATAQNAAILEAIKTMDYEAKSLPKYVPGKSGVKALIRAAVATNVLFQGRVFDKAWERLRSSGEIADAI
jgi:hypothetical protein